MPIGRMQVLADCSNALGQSLAVSSSQRAGNVWPNKEVDKRRTATSNLILIRSLRVVVVELSRTEGAYRPLYYRHSGPSWNPRVTAQRIANSVDDSNTRVPRIREENEGRRAAPVAGFALCPFFAMVFTPQRLVDWKNRPLVHCSPLDSVG